MNQQKAFIWEALAVISSLAYTILITYNSVWCWIFSLVASGIYLYLCFIKRIYAESTLHLFYLVTSVYGWMNWGEGVQAETPEVNWQLHVGVIGAGFALTIISGFLLRRLTDAATPFIDSFTTVFSIFATILMIQLLPSNWLYWIIIDLVSVYLYLQRGMRLTAFLFLLYTALAVNGYMQWTLG